MKKNELKVLKILAEIQNPDKIIDDMAKQIIYLATERASERDGTWTNDSVRKHLEYYMNHLHERIEKEFK